VEGPLERRSRRDRRWAAEDRDCHAAGFGNYKCGYRSGLLVPRWTMLQSNGDEKAEISSFVCVLSSFTGIMEFIGFISS
jgi:hypothetical protein